MTQVRLRSSRWAGVIQRSRLQFRRWMLSKLLTWLHRIVAHLLHWRRRTSMVHMVGSHHVLRGLLLLMMLLLVMLLLLLLLLMLLLLL